jgi:hypothetical protein
MPGRRRTLKKADGRSVKGEGFISDIFRMGYQTLRKILKSGCVLSVLTVLTVQVRAADTTYDNKDAGFAMRTPSGWFFYPKEVMAQSYGARAKLDPTPPLREIAAILGRATNLYDESFPRIVVHIQPRARVGETQYRALHMYPIVEKTVAETLGFAGDFRFMRSGIYDMNAQCLNFTFRSRGPDGEMIAALGSSYLTAEGLINIYCYAKGEDFDDWVDRFRDILATIHISPEHRRHAKPVVQSLAEKASDWMILGKVLGAMVIVACAKVLLPRFGSNVRSDEV